MTEVEIKSLLETFKKSAAELNSASNDINAIIESYEAELVAANAGLEYWEPRLRLEERWFYEQVEQLKIYAAPQLGFTKLRDEWRLAVRELRIIEGFNDDGETTYQEDAPEGSTPRALADSTRAYRIAALAQLPEFLKGLNGQVKEALETIDRAKRVVGQKLRVVN